MSYVVNTSTVEFYRGRQYHSGGVAVSVSGVAASFTPEDTHIQREPLLGSRTTTRTGHRRIGGRNQHHLPPRPRGTFDQLPLRDTDRSVRSLPGHAATSKEFRCEVFHRNRVVVGHHTARPHARCMSVLPSCFLVQASGLAARLLIPLAGRLPSWPTSASHLPLSPSEFCGAAAPIARVWQIMVGAGGGRGRGDTPVDPDFAVCGRGRHCWAPHHKRRIPVPKGISIHPDRGGRGRQLPRPDHRNRYLSRQPQLAVLDREPASGVLQRRQSRLPGLGCRFSPPSHLEGVPESVGVVAQHLLLRDLRPVAQPRHPTTRFGKHLRQTAERWTSSDSLLVDGFVPHESTTMPFGLERTRRVRAWAQAVGVAHDLIHADSMSEASDNSSSSRAPTMASRLPSSKACLTVDVRPILIPVAAAVGDTTREVVNLMTRPTTRASFEQASSPRPKTVTDR